MRGVKFCIFMIYRSYMKSLFSFTTIFCAIIFNCSSQIKESDVLDSLYTLMEKKDVYLIEKEERVSEIKKLQQVSNISKEQIYDINYRLYNEYKTYIADSAISYAQKNTLLAKDLSHKDWIYESNLDLVSLYIISGMYLDAIDILKSMNSRSIDQDWLLVKYYDCYKQLYISYSDNNIYTYAYGAKSDLYRDSLLNVLDKTSNHYKIVYAEKLYDEELLDEAKEVLFSIYNSTQGDTHEKAVIAYAIANVYKKKGDASMEIYYYATSAICDIKNAIKENASMRALSSVLYEQGNINMAYKCIKQSMEDAMFCNARLRSYEVSQIFPIIDSAYQDNIEKQKSELKFFLILVSLMSLFLIIAVIYVYRQMKRVARIRKELSDTNTKLNDLNTDLQETVNKLNIANAELSTLNTELSETNKIKEVYIGHFLDLCSTYIEKLEKFQNNLNKKAIEKKFDELSKILKSKDMIDSELRDLYVNFDNIFLHLYPNFVQEFNSLLLTEEQFVLKPKELLNVELRIFALIRLGISDSSKIAKFLHYSANTIYTYRTRVRNKSLVPRDQFESMVMKIGTIMNK